MINKSILDKRLLNQFRNRTLNTIVTECFIKSLPFSKKDLSHDDIKKLAVYSSKVLEHIDGYDKVIESLSNIKDIKHQAFLTDILGVCNSVALEATKRISTDAITTKKENIKEVLDTASFSDTEYNKFKNAKDNIDLDAVSSLITEKTMKVIKEEKEMQEKDDEVKKQLSDVLMESKNFSEVSLESYMDLILKKNDPRTPVTLFSKILEASIENIQCTKEKYKRIPFDALEKITFNSTLNMLKKNEEFSLESILMTTEVDEKPNPTEDINEDSTEECNNQKKIMDTSMVCSIIIYTILEVLNTFNIATPSINEIREFISSPVNNGVMINYSSDNIINAAYKVIDDVNNLCIKCNDKESLNACLNKLEDIKYRLLAHSLLDIVNNKEEVDKLYDYIDSTKKSIETKLTGEVNTNELGFFEKKDRDMDISKLNKLYYKFDKDSSINALRLVTTYTDRALNCIICEVCYNGGNLFEEQPIYISLSTNNGDEYLDDIFNSSLLKNFHAPVYTYIKDYSNSMRQLK